jgi:uncharacterized protein YegP (UPF0339 family)
MAEAEFERFMGKDGDWYWRFRSTNGKEICRSSEGYSSLDNCDNSIRVVQEQAAGAKKT